ncbi:MAG: SNF2-related protein [Blastocatellales bacterium]
MARKISSQIRKKLMEAAKQRWAKYREVDSPPLEKTASRARKHPRPKPKTETLIEALDTASLSRKAGTIIAQRGRNYYLVPERFWVDKLDAESAIVMVQGSDDYMVEFNLKSDGEVVIICDCPYADEVPEIICKHKIAAALHLKNRFAPKTVLNDGNSQQIGEVVTPESLWRERLSDLLRPEILPGRNIVTDSILFFIFEKQGRGYILKTCALPVRALPAEIWKDRAALRDYFLKNSLTLTITANYLSSSTIKNHRFLNASPELEALLSQITQPAMNSYYRYEFGYDYEYGNSANSSLWLGLANALVFRGGSRNLIEGTLDVLPEISNLVIEIQRDENGIKLYPALKSSSRTVRLDAPGLEIFNSSPLWLRHGDEIFQARIEDRQFQQLRKKREVVIPAESLGEFVQSNLQQLASSCELIGENLIGGTLTAISPQPRIYLTENAGELRALLRFAYNNLDCQAMKKPPQHSFVFDEENGVAVKIERQTEAETEWWKRLNSAEFGLKSGYLRDGTGHDTFLLRKAFHPFDFLKNMVPKLAESGVEIFGEADLTLAKINRAKPTISFNISSDIDWFDVKAVINFGELEVSLAEIRKSLRKKERFIKLADGSVGEIPEEWLEKYKHLFGLSEIREDGFRVSRHHLTLLDQLLENKEQVVADKQFEIARQWLKDFQGIASQTLPSGFNGELRPYQKAGFDWLHFLREANFGGCLADDMGTGKTIQTLCFLQSLKEQYEERNRRKRKKEPRAAHLLIVPRSLVTNWEREAQKFAPDLKILNFSQAERAADITEFNDYDVVLTTYGILLREIERLVEYEFDTVILDEAQAIKNPVSESAKAARLLKCRHRLTLTGTPVENNTLELWSQFAFLNPGLLGSIDYFREQFTTPIERQQDEQTTKTLKRLVYPFILRRTKDQVELDLPPRSEKILWNEMGPEQRKLYNQTRDEYRAKILKLIEDKEVKDARFRILEGLLRLRQICNHPKLVLPGYRGSSAKLDTLIETLETLRAEDHKALIFSQFVQMLKLVEQSLKKAKIPYTYLDGSTINRQARVDAFQTDDQIKVFLISLKAGGVGLNLTAADYVIHVDPWWNPAVEMQATDRAHRIGQDKPVFVYKLMMRDSVEEKILLLQERKRTLVKQLISTEAGFFKSLTADDIKALFS